MIQVWQFCCRELNSVIESSLRDIIDTQWSADHRVDSVIESSLHDIIEIKNYALNTLS